MNILIVDDDAIMLKMASLMIKKLGHQSGLATNGIEAIEALERSPYDIIFMDIQMPEMNGLMATKIIRQRWNNNHKIIVSALDFYQDACFAAGADDFLPKPFRIEDLRGSIGHHMPIQAMPSESL